MRRVDGVEHERAAADRVLELGHLEEGQRLQADQVGLELLVAAHRQRVARQAVGVYGRRILAARKMLAALARDVERQFELLTQRRIVRLGLGAIGFMKQIGI